MQLEYEEKEDAYRRQKDVDIHTPASIEYMPHREPVLRITNMSDGTFVATSQDGTISFWSGNMELKRTRSVMVWISFISIVTRSVIWSMVFCTLLY